MKNILVIHPSRVAINIISNHLDCQEQPAFNFHHFQTIPHQLDLKSYGFCLIDESCLPMLEESLAQAWHKEIPLICLYDGLALSNLHPLKYDPACFYLMSYSQLDRQHLDRVVYQIRTMLDLRRELREQQQALWQTKGELSLTSRKLEHFTDFVSHDIRPYISRVLGLTELTRMQMHQADLSELQDLTWKSAKKLDEMVMAIHEYLYLQKDLVTDNEETIHLKSLIRQVLDGINEELHSVGARVKILLDDDAVVCTMHKGLKLSLHNLLNSMLEFASNDFVIEINFQSHDGQFWLTLSDNGIGYASKRKRVLPEAKIEVSTYVAYSLLEDLGIAMEVSCDPGKGTAYHLGFPSYSLPEQEKQEKQVPFS